MNERRSKEEEEEKKYYSQHPSTFERKFPDVPLFSFLVIELFFLSSIKMRRSVTGIAPQLTATSTAPERSSQSAATAQRQQQMIITMRDGHKLSWCALVYASISAPRAAYTFFGNERTAD